MTGERLLRQEPRSDGGETASAFGLAVTEGKSHCLEISPPSLRAKRGNLVFELQRCFVSGVVSLQPVDKCCCCE